jgi:hypothetical protein
MPTPAFAWLMQVQACIGLWRDAGFGETPGWLKDQLALAHEAHRQEQLARAWSKQVEMVE